MTNSTAQRTQLAPQEVLTLVAVLGLIFTLCAISVANFSPLEPEVISPGVLSPEPLVSVQVDGAVAAPGVYVVAKGATLEALLDQVALLPNANLENLNVKTRVRQSKKIWIPYKNRVAVTLKGAVKSPGRHLLPLDTKIRDLADLGLLANGADVRALKKRRAKLKDNQTLAVPFA